MKLLLIPSVICLYGLQAHANGLVVPRHGIANLGLFQEMNQYDARAVRAQAEILKGEIQAEIDRERRVIIATNVAGSPEYESALANLTARQSSSQCLSQNIAMTLQERLYRNCDILDTVSTCQETSLSVSGRLNSATERLSVINNPTFRRSRPVLEMMQEAHEAFANLLRPGGYIRAELNKCLNQLRILGKPRCINTYRDTFTEFANHNIRNVCSTEAVDAQVESFIREMGEQGVSSLIRTAQEQYAQGRRAETALALILLDLDRTARQLMTSTTAETANRQPSAAEDPL